MKKKITFAVLGVAAVLLVYFTVFSSGKTEINVLVFSKTEGFRHESIEPGIEAVKKLGEQYNFQVEATEDASVFNEEKLKDFHVIIFLNTTQDILNPEQQVQMERFIQAGGGFVGVHAAIDTEYAWPWYGKLVGAYFDGHPSNPNVREATLQVLNTNHSATDSLPKDWIYTDEWYNLKAINQENNVLINLDESTYEGGTNGENHPIAWYKEYDGGRMFYTGLGHTVESYSDPLFLKHLAGGIKYAIGAGTPVDYSQAYSEVMPEENRFTKVLLTQNLNEPMELDFLSDDKIIFIERKGGIHLFNLSVGQNQQIAQLPVHTGHEDGLLGVAVDPNYAENHWVYFFYSPPGDTPKQHISRFTLENDSLLAESEQVLLEIPTQREECCHSGGSLEFGPNGNLFISVGDNTNPHESDGYGPIDERDGRSPWDAQKSASNTNDLRGKILRIKPEADGSYSIPEGNLFATDGSVGRPEIYTMGNRNPFRISIDSHTGYLYWGEVGPDARKDSVSRGPKGHDEINQAKQAGNYGWPYFVADNKAYHDYDFAAEESGKAFDPEKPVNNSPNSTGATELPPAQPAMVYYPYDASEEFPLLGTGSRNAMAGPVYYRDDYAESGRNFPEYFNGKVFVYDWMRQWIFLATLNEQGDLDKLTPFVPNMKFNNTIDMTFGPDGALYVLEYGSGWFSQNPDSKLARIEYTAGNRAPIAKLEADKTIGGVPLTVQFAGRNSIDYDADPLTYKWNFGNEEAESSETNPSYTFEEPGVYQVELTVTDKEGKESSTTTEIKVGNELPQLSWAINKGNQTFFWPDQPLNLNYAINVSDVEDGSLTGGTIDPSRVIVSFDYLPEGRDKVLAAKDHAELADASIGMIGKQLIANSDCMACHKEAGESIGPAYQKIAQRYQGDETARDMLAGKIVQGGSGNWGEVAMAAHPGISTQQAAQMVDYILSLSDDAPRSSQYPPQGTYTSRSHLEKNPYGSYVLTASYTDQGGQAVGPLSVQQSLLLRHPRIEAEDYDEGQAMKFPIKAEDTPGIDEDMTIVVGQHGKSFMFRDIDLTGVAAIKGQFGLAPGITKGGTVEYRLDAPDGELLGSAKLEQGLTTMGFKEPITTINEVSGKHDIYVVFVGEKDDEEVLVAVVNWIEFINQSEAI